MIEELIHYLVDLPTETTAPLYLAVNSVAFLAAHDSSIAEIPVIDTMPDDPNKTAAYVRLYGTGSQSPYDRTLGNAGYSETQILKIEYCSQGETKYQAASRAGDLRRAVEARLNALKGTVIAGALTKADPNGAGGYDKITNWQLANSNNPEQPPTRIVGVNRNIYTARKYTTLEVVVTHH